jgi:hypothetical protein
VCILYCKINIDDVYVYVYIKICVCVRVCVCVCARCRRSGRRSVHKSQEKVEKCVSAC